jgi:hypothetical protein
MGAFVPFRLLDTRVFCAGVLIWALTVDPYCGAAAARNRGAGDTLAEGADDGGDDEGAEEEWL